MDLKKEPKLSMNKERIKVPKFLPKVISTLKKLF